MRSKDLVIYINIHKDDKMNTNETVFQHSRSDLVEIKRIEN